MPAMSRIFSNLKLRGFPQFRTYYMLFSASRQEGIFLEFPQNYPYEINLLRFVIHNF